MHMKCYEDISDLSLNTTFWTTFSNLNKVDAQILFNKCIENSTCPITMNLIGLCYNKGIGVPGNQQLAVEWFTKAANLKNAYSMCNLGMAYNDGFGRNTKDRKKAFEWYLKSASLGCAYAVERLEEYHYDNFKDIFVTDSEVEAAKSTITELEKENQILKN
jgi:TPR repeat protein